MDWVFDPQLWISLLTLTALEIVLGIDNIIFISILAGKLPSHQQARARTVGLSLALITRILLLCSIVWLIGLTKPWFELFGHAFSGKDIVLLLGGLFLLAKSTHEIHGSLEGVEGERSVRFRATMASVITQIIIMDIVFSLDSVITAVGLAQQIGVMIAAVIIAVIVMLISSGAISDFVNRHPTVKMLALSFLLMIGVMLVADGLGRHIPRGYIYFAMAFSVGVELLNIRARGRRAQTAKPVQLHQSYRPDPQ
jgi:predicted tellurium resistance membrane protein TerC